MAKTPNSSSSSKAQATPPTIKTTREFFLDDYPRTLFPLRTNRVLVEHGYKQIEDYIAACLDKKDKAHSFLPQQRVYAAKPNWHLRRTVKLDPVAEYYVYDVVFRNRSLFSPAVASTRTHFGYRFESDRPLPASDSYRAFRTAITTHSKKYKSHISLDIASYFNSLYHHDIVAWLDELGASSSDVEGFGQFLREINSGRSVDCLPQGLYPTKMIGNDILKFVDESHKLKCGQLIRFMDDIYLFGNDETSLNSDFISIQKSLGEYGLSVNPKKTNRDSSPHTEISTKISDAKKSLLSRRRYIIKAVYDDEEDAELTLKTPLTDDELKYVGEILSQDEMEEEDAELVLTVMRDNTSGVLGRLPYIIANFPNLAKSIYAFAASVKDPDKLAHIVETSLEKDALHEYQLFWFGMMLEDYLMDTRKASKLIDTIFSHPAASIMVKAKILEIPDNRYGLPELRLGYLRSGQSDWLSWAAAVGTRNSKKAARNYRLAYFSKSSAMNHLVSEILRAMP